MRLSSLQLSYFNVLDTSDKWWRFKLRKYQIRLWISRHTKDSGNKIRNYLWNYPNFVRAIDGRHVRICAPADSGHSSYKYKGHVSFSRSQLGSQLPQGKPHLPAPATLLETEVLSAPLFVTFPLMQPYSGEFAIHTYNYNR